MSFNTEMTYAKLYVKSDIYPAPPHEQDTTKVNFFKA